MPEKKMSKGKKGSVPNVNGYSSAKRDSKAMIDIDLCPSPVSEKDGTPLRPIFILKTREKMRDVEEREDCFILEFDPDDSLKLSVSKGLANVDSSCDLCVIAEKGQVACRDYPHSRHVCLKYPFAITPHESYCKLCYCYVCDLAAPCEKWTGKSGHCHATDSEAWKSQRVWTRHHRRMRDKTSSSC